MGKVARKLGTAGEDKQAQQSAKAGRGVGKEGTPTCTMGNLAPISVLLGNRRVTCSMQSATSRRWDTAQQNELRCKVPRVNLPPYCLSACTAHLRAPAQPHPSSYPSHQARSWFFVSNGLSKLATIPSVVQQASITADAACVYGCLLSLSLHHMHSLDPWHWHAWGFS